MKKILLSWVVLLVAISMVLGFSLAGCKAATTETTAAAETTAAETTAAETTAAETTAAAQPVTLELWDWQLDENFTKNYVQKVIDKFKEVHPNVTINYVQYPYADYSTNLKVAITGGKTPAILEVYPGSDAIDLANGGTILDITDKIKNDPEWVSDLGNGMNAKDLYINGKIYYSPISVGHMSLAYDKIMFADRNLKPPETIDELYAIGEVFKAEGIVPIATGFGDFYAMTEYFTLLSQMKDTTGTLLEDANAGKTSWQNPVFKYALQTILDFKDKGLWPKDYMALNTYPDLFDAFTKEKYPMFFPFSTGLAAVASKEVLDRDQIGVIPMPRQDDTSRTVFTGGMWATYSVSASLKSPELELALEFLKMMTAPWAQQLQFNIGKQVPGSNIDTSNVSKLQAQLYKDQSTGTIVWYTIDNAGVAQAIQDGVQKVLLGGSIDEVLKSMDDAQQAK